MDAALTVIAAALGWVAQHGPAVYRVIVGDARPVAQVLAEARAAAEQIPERPAGAALDAHAARVRAELSDADRRALRQLLLAAGTGHEQRAALRAVLGTDAP